MQGAIDMVRSVHPAFSRYMVPDKSLADFFTREQQRLMTLAVLRDRSYLAQSLSILFDLAHADTDAPGVAGANTSGGVPGVASNGTYAAVQATTGSAVEVDAGTIAVADTLVASATSTTLTGTGVAWVVDAYIGKIVLITAGTGAGQAPRSITTNSATVVTVSSAWDVTPDSTSLFTIVAPVQSIDQTVGVVTDLPATTVQRGYLVKLNASGVPYLDYTSPLVAHVSRGIPLPQLHTVLGGIVRYASSSDAWSSPQSDYGAIPLTLVPNGMRYRSFRGPAAHVRGGQLFLVGGRAEWENAESIELSYVPIPTAFAARTDLFLLPDSAVGVIAARGALFAASRITGLPDVPQPPSDLLASEAERAEAAWLSSVSLTTRSRIGRVAPGLR